MRSTCRSISSIRAKPDFQRKMQLAAASLGGWPDLLNPGGRQDQTRRVSDPLIVIHALPIQKPV